MDAFPFFYVVRLSTDEKGHFPFYDVIKFLSLMGECIGRHRVGKHFGMKGLQFPPVESAVESR